MVFINHVKLQKTLINRPALGVFPSADWPQRLRNVLISVAPHGMQNVFTMACGSCSNENAYKVAMFSYRIKERGGSLDFNDEEMTSVMKNQPPGTPDLSIMSFEVNMVLQKPVFDLYLANFSQDKVHDVMEYCVISGWFPRTYICRIDYDTIKTYSQIGLRSI